MQGGTNACTNAGVPDPRPARGEERGGAIALGGPRQRALLVALLLRAGRVVPTEQLVDELYGAEPPKTATTSLQNSVVALRKALGPDVLVTRPPGYVLAVSPEQIDARRFERLLADARRAAAGGAPRAALAGARALARARRSPSSRSRSGRRPRSRRLDELRLVAVEERIAADVELGRAGRRRPRARVARRRASAARAPLRAAHARALPRRAPGGRARGLRRPPRGARRARPRAGRGAPAAPGGDPPPRGRAARRGRNGGDARRRRGDRQGARRGPRRPGARARRRRRPRRPPRGRVRLPERPPARPRARLAVRRDDERLRAALRRAAPAVRGGASSRSRCTASSRRCRRCSASAARRIS